MTYRAPIQTQIPPIAYPDTLPQPRRVLVTEVVAADPAQLGRLPALDGWKVQMWPVARLGDATLEAQALRPDLSADDLRLALAQAGWQTLGPVRAHR